MKTFRKSNGVRLVQGLLQMAALPAMLASAGCRSTQQRIERYLGANTNRPEVVQQALRDGVRLVPGMTPQEVRLMLGPPARSEKGPSQTEAAWHYDLPKRRDDTLQHSDMWKAPVPWQTVVFGPDNTVAEIISYDEEKTVFLPETPPPAAMLKPPPEPRTPATAAAMPSYRAEPDEIHVYGWPAITLQGLSGSGNSRSAAINGTVHEPGDWIGAVLLDAVYANGVVLEYRGQRAFLRPGESTGSRDDTK